MMKRIGFLALGLMLSILSVAQTDKFLNELLSSISDEWGLEVGIAFLTPEGETVGINMDRAFPLLSVVKMHQAMAVCDKLRNRHTPLDKMIKVKPKELAPDTWSPMRDEWPDGGMFSIRFIIEQSLINSDNNACDILFRRFANPRSVDRFIHNIGIDDCNIKYSEVDMHGDINRCYQNWMTPRAALSLLEYLYDEKDSDEYSRFVWNSMAKCETGKNRIPRFITDRTATIVHKTGTGPIDQNGRLMALNNIACIVLPNGQHVNLAVFIRDSKKSLDDCEEFIARVAQTCIDYINN